MSELKVQSGIVNTFDDVARMAEMFYKSGLFPDLKSAFQSGVKIMAGRELDVGPFASINGFHIIQSKVSMSGNLMASLVKRSPKYDYKVLKADVTVCEIEFLENGQSLGISIFTMDDAKKAGLVGRDNWNKYPRNMLFNRAISNGSRWYTPDVFCGATYYTPDELGDEVVKEDENVIEGEAVEPETEVAANVSAAVKSEDIGQLYIDKIEECKDLPDLNAVGNDIQALVKDDDIKAAIRTRFIAKQRELVSKKEYIGKDINSTRDEENRAADHD